MLTIIAIFAALACMLLSIISYLLYCVLEWLRHLVLTDTYWHLARYHEHEENADETHS